MSMTASSALSPTRKKALSPRLALDLELDYTLWQGDTAGVTGARSNDRKGMSLTFGLMRKF
jgi:hypothetical protein